MNPPVDPTEPDPLAPAVDPRDERLSAALDGPADPDFVAGSAPVTDTDDRARAVAAARDLLAVAPPPLDDLTRRRMLRNALDAREAPTHGRRGWAARAAAPAAAAACVALVVLGVWALIHAGGSSNSSSKSAASATSGPATKTAAKIDLREVSDPAVLLQKVEAALRGTAQSSTPDVAPAPTTATDANGPAVACLSAVRVPAGTHAGVLGPATFHGAPAVVIVARDGPRILIYVLATPGCRLLSSQFLRQ
ncbi:MAG TPA: hypothetical protein VIK61_20790 [Acidimicrobiia bacterium]